MELFKVRWLTGPMHEERHLYVDSREDLAAVTVLLESIAYRYTVEGFGMTLLDRSSFGFGACLKWHASLYGEE